MNVFRTDDARFARAHGASAHLRASYSPSRSSTLADASLLGHIDTSTILIALSAVLSVLLFVALTYTGLQARAGKVWAGGMSVRGKGKGKHRSRSDHSRRSSGRRVADENAPLLEETSAAEEA